MSYCLKCQRKWKTQLYDIFNHVVAVVHSSFKVFMEIIYDNAFIRSLLLLLLVLLLLSIDILLY